MRQGQYEKELQSLKCELRVIPTSLIAIKRQGREVKACEKQVRKNKVKFEYARRACLDLPKPWKSYHAHGKFRNLYTRPEVQAIHEALNKLHYSIEKLKKTIESYQNRYDARKAFKARLRLLPDEIECVKALYEIELKRKVAREAKAKPKTDWKLHWQEVAPGLVVAANKLKSYLKTFDNPIPLNDDTVKINYVKDTWNETIKYFFTFQPFNNRRTYLKLPCYTWEQAERERP